MNATPHNPGPPTDLYRYFDAEDVLLYVGVSLAAATRAMGHRRQSGWWSSWHRMTRETCPTRLAAIEAERLAIRTEKPLFNIVHNRPRAEHAAAEDESPTSVIKVGDVAAFGLANGRCFVGLVTSTLTVGYVSLGLVDWVTGMFSRGEIDIKLSAVNSIMKARLMFYDEAAEVDGWIHFDRVFDLDPLAAFQNAWEITDPDDLRPTSPATVSRPEPSLSPVELIGWATGFR